MSTERVSTSIFDLPSGADPFAEEAPAVVEAPAAKPVAKAPAVAAPVVEAPAPEVEVPNPDESVEEEVPAEEGTESANEEVAEEEKPEGKQVTLSDDDEVPILQDGKVVFVKWGEHKGNVMRMADYTRKAQAVATERQKVTEAASQLQVREEKLLNILRDPTKRRELFTKLEGGEAPKVEKPAVESGEDGDTLIAKKDLAAHMTQFETNLRKQLKAEREAERNAERDETLTQEQTKFATQINTTIETTLDTILKDPTVAETLADEPYIDRQIRALAAESNPLTPEEVKQALINAAKTLHEKRLAKMGKKLPETKVVPLKKKVGIVPKGGGAPAQKVKTYEKGGNPRKADWESLDNDVIAWIDGGAA